MKQIIKYTTYSVIGLSLLSYLQSPSYINDSKNKLNNIVDYHIFGNEKSNNIVYLLHGWPDNYKVFQPTIDYFLKNKKDCKIVALNLPNYENRDNKPVYGYDLVEVVELIKNTIDKTKNDAIPENITLIGHDWGSIILYLLLSKYKNISKRFISLDVGIPKRSIAFLLFAIFYQGILNTSYSLGELGSSVVLKGLLTLMEWENYEGGPTPSYYQAYLYRRLWANILFLSGPSRYIEKNFEKWKPEKDLQFLFIYAKSKPFFANFHSKEWFDRVLINEKSYAKGVKGDHWFLIKNPDVYLKELDNFLESTNFDKSKL